MRILIFAALATVLCGPYLLWQCAIRPYCIRHGQGYTPGANWGVTLWVDWQQAREMADARNDRGIRLACRLFLAIHIAFAAVIILAIIASTFRT